MNDYPHGDGWKKSTEGKEFPHGDGWADCPACYGRGAVSVKFPGMITPATKPCLCVTERDRLLNMERRWKGLAHVTPVTASPLQGFELLNLRITSRQGTLKSHLHYLAKHQIPDWNFAVESDRELAKAWLYTKRMTGDAYDPDVALTEPKYLSLEDLSDHADLLVVCLGVKAARNSASPELLVDVCQGRDFLGKPTWVVDEPFNLLQTGHLSHSDNVDALFEDWTHLELYEGQGTQLAGYLPPAPAQQEALIPRQTPLAIGEEYEESYEEEDAEEEDAEEEDAELTPELQALLALNTVTPKKRW